MKNPSGTAKSYGLSSKQPCRPLKWIVGAGTQVCGAHPRVTADPATARRAVLLRTAEPGGVAVDPERGGEALGEQAGRELDLHVGEAIDTKRVCCARGQ